MNANLKTGVVGPAGTVSHEAAVKMGAKNVKFLTSIFHVFTALENDEVDQIIVPIENVIRGTVGDTVDSLNDTDTKILAEIKIPIHLCFAIPKGMKKEDIKYIASDQRALAQCLMYLNKKFPDQELKPRASAPIAMKNIIEYRLKHAAVIGSKFAAQHYGLEIIDEDIEDRKGNVTRYLLISKDGKTKPTGNDKTTIFMYFKESDKPGQLYRALGCFANNDINLTKLDSRPSREELGSYFLFLEFKGHVDDANVKKALTQLKEYADYRILGSYAKYD